MSAFRWLFVLVLSVSAPVSAAESGRVVVGGDITGTFSLNRPEFGGVQGNRTFFARVAGGATRVAINARTANSFATGNLVSFYGFDQGAQVVTLASFSAQSLAGVGLLALVMPN